MNNIGHFECYRSLIEFESWASENKWIKLYHYVNDSGIKFVHYLTPNGTAVKIIFNSSNNFDSLEWL